MSTPAADSAASFRAAGATRRVGTPPDGPDALDPSRTLWVAWDGVDAIRRAAPQLSGRELLEAINRGELPAPPVHHVLDIANDGVEAGVVAFTMTPHELHYNPMGVVHGGVLSLLLDSAMGCAVNSMLPAGTGYTTVDLHVTFVRAVTVDSGPLRAEGRALHVGGRVATAEGRITDAAGRLVAHGSESCLLTSGARETVREGAR
jgi:uncharacterized protein (TIGR00369 family)